MSYKTTMTEEIARSIMPNAIIYHYESPWLVLQTDDRTEYKRTGRHFLVRFGSKGEGGHQHWGWWEDFDLTPHR